MNFAFFSTHLPPEESMSRKLDNDVKRQEMPYGYDMNPFMEKMSNEHLDKDYGKKERIITKK